MSKLYIPITGSPEGKVAYKKALDFAKIHKLDVVFIAVRNIELVNKLKRYKVFIDEEVKLYNSTMQKDIENYLNFMKKQAEDAGINAEVVILEGEPYHKIMNFIKEDKESHKILFIPKKLGGECIRDVFSPVERKLLINGDFDILVIGEEV